MRGPSIDKVRSLSNLRALGACSAGLLAGAFWVLLGTGPASADCVAQNGSTTQFLCSGTLPADGLFIQTEVPDTANLVDVQNIANDIALLEWVAPQAAGPEVELNVSTLPSFTIGNSDPDGLIVAVRASGTSGAQGGNSSTKSGGNGGNGTNGRTITLSLAGDFFQTGPIFNGAAGINVASVAGEGGNGGVTTCPFPLGCDGGNGGIGGDGGNISATFDGTITFGNSANTFPNESAAIVIVSVGNTGGDGGQGDGVDGGINDGGDAGFGGNGGIVQLVGGSQGGNVASITTAGQVVPGVLAASTAGAGGDGGHGANNGGDGGRGGAGSSVCLDGDCSQASSTAGWSVATQGDKSYGIQLLSTGGDGGAGNNGTDKNGGRGGDAGSAGMVIAHGDTTGLRTITTKGESSPAFLAKSIAGAGGNGGSGKDFGDGGSGGFGGTAGDVSLAGQWDISTSGDDSTGIAALSLGGPGGVGGDGGACCDTKGGGGGSSGPAGNVTISLDSGSQGISTKGTGSHAVLAQSIGGHAGSAGTADSLVVSFAASAGSAGAAGEVTVTNSGGAPISTEGNGAVAIFAQSIGGGGGNGGDSSSIPGFADFYAQGGNGSIGANGGTVSIENAGSISTFGNASGGIVAQSVGGTGGSGGTSSAKIVSIGGRASDGANGGTVTIDNSGDISGGINTGDAGADAVCQTGCSPGIVAQSIGGGGGIGGSSFSEFSLGGRAGGGGDGQDVSVSNSGMINPASAKESPGIHAQSIGGGGGRGGASFAAQAGLAIAVGAAGGPGGDGAKVTITNSNEVSPGGTHSPGLWAQSIGGGGGHGGTTAALSADFELPSLSLAVGAAGGSGGSGSDVSVINANAEVGTFGQASPAIFAQSVGGGGGSGGLTISGTGTVGDGSVGISMAFGSNGGPGGDGGTVTVGSGGNILNTADADSPAIFAQSVGGGGGKGGTTISVNANVEGSGGANVALGSAGGGGGVGKAVTVNSDTALIETGADESSGIMAQSVGGGGGNAGMTFSGGLTTSSDSFSLGIAVGASAGTGGAGGTVDVAVTKPSSGNLGFGIEVTGNRSKGIHAQSVGGGGGNGGLTLNGAFSTSTDSNMYDLTLGSTGGDGGDGSDVSVSNAQAITTGTAGQTSFTQAHGILAQSVGGGGGSGAVTGTLQLSATSEEEDHTLDLQMSSSGSGGTGGKVTISNSGSVTTVNQNSHAVFGQSIGGGGGDADSAFLSLANIVGNNPAPTLSTEYTAAGSLGAGSDGGDVGLTNSGALTTKGSGSHGLFAQSVGGGGGSSGSLGNPFQDCGRSSGCNAANTTWNATVQLGGQTGNGGDGGDLTVTNSGGITTDGPGSYALFAQSIGYGGGSAGDASALSQGSQAVGVTEFTVLNAALGAVAGSSSESGNGGDIEVTLSDGFLLTNGIGSTALYAQSVGAGGGRGGTGAIGQGGTVSVGGGGAATGDGGDITITIDQSHSIVSGVNTSGSGITVASYGIFAQSVGGGGGHAGNVSLATNDYSLYGTGLAMSQNTTKAGGNGGDVAVKLDGDVETFGKGSIGVFAQSVGGGGGIAGEVSHNPTGAMIGSTGGDGTAGLVDVTITNSVATNGETAHGVFVQSVGGLTSSGPATTTDTKVSVTLSGSNAIVFAGGAGSSGIYAQSSGQGKGPIEILIDEGASLFHGGPLGNTGIVGAGIVIQEGTTNTIVNKGTIQLAGSSNRSAGVAIRAIDVPGVTEPSQVAITNTGTMDGWICVDFANTQQCSLPNDTAAPPGAAAATSSTPMKTTEITLVNEEGGVLNTGDVYEVAHLINRGTMRPGGQGRITTLEHHGSLEHAKSGVMEMSLNPTTNRADRMNISGTADLQGDVEIELLNLGPAKDRSRVTLVVADGGLSSRSASEFTVTPSVVAGYELDFVSDKQVDLSYQVDFANDDVLASSGRNQDAVANHIQDSFAAGTLPSELTSLVDIQDMASYQNALGSMDAQIYADTQLTTLYSSLLFKDSMLSCGERTGDYRFIEELQCGWMRVTGRHLNRDGTSTSRGFDENAFQLAGGGQYEVNGDWLFGGALSIEYRSLDEDGGFADADGWQFQGGLVAKRQFGNTMISGAFSGGYASFDANRNVFGGSQTDGDQSLWLISGELRAEHAFDFDTWFVKPRSDIGIDYVSSGSLTESGAGSLNLDIQQDDDVYVYLQPAVEVGMEHVFDSGTVARPWISLGMTAFLTNNSPTATASFVGTSGSSFSSVSDLDRTYADLEIGVDVLTAYNVNIQALGAGRLSGNTQTYGGGLKASLLF